MKSSAYRKKKEILAELEAGREVHRQCRRCQEWFRIFELQYWQQDFLCIECDYELRDLEDQDRLLSLLRIKSCGPLLSQAVEALTD